MEGQCSRVLKCLGNGSATLMARMCPPQVTDTKLSQIYNPPPSSIPRVHPLPLTVFLNMVNLISPKLDSISDDLILIFPEKFVCVPLRSQTLN